MDAGCDVINEDDRFGRKIPRKCTAICMLIVVIADMCGGLVACSGGTLTVMCAHLAPHNALASRGIGGANMTCSKNSLEIPVPVPDCRLESNLQTHSI
jgi:hypothetical protein